MKRLTSTAVLAFRKRIYDHYDKHGRSLPWWKIRDPYRVTTTEIAVDLEAALEQFTKIAARLSKGKGRYTDGEHVMKKLKVDLKELVFEMEMGDNMALAGYLDTETGEIISMPDSVMRAVEDSDEAAEALPDWEQELVETAENILGDEKNRFLLIQKRESREEHEIMVAFTESVRKKGLQEKLSSALNGRGAFRRFRSVLNDHPDELERWYKFKDDWMREEAVQWLILNGIEPVQVVSGYFNDDGTEINADLVPKPGLCLTCRKDSASGKEEILCVLTRNDQKDDDDFECGAYEPNE